MITSILARRVHIQPWAVAVALLPLVGVTLLIFGLRFASVLRAGEGRGTFGIVYFSGEPIGVYNVAKIGKGMPLYEDPTSPPYPVTLYNPGFYYLYSACTRLFVSEDSQLVLACRLCTAALTGLLLLAYMGFAHLCFLRLPPGQRNKWAYLVAILVSVYVTFSTFYGYWSLIIRSDVGGSAFCLLAIVSLFALEGKSDQWAGVVSGLLFVAAWSFKQSFVLIFVGTLLANLLHRRWTILWGQVLLFALVAGSFLLLFGENYWQNAIVGPSLDAFRQENMIDSAVYFLVKSTVMSFVFPAALLALLALKRCQFLTVYMRTALRTAFFSCLVGACGFSLRDGSSLNYFFELWLICASLVIVLAFRALGPVGQRATETCGLPVAALVLLTGSLLLATSLDVARLFDLRPLGPLRRSMPADEVTEEARIGSYCRSATRPIYCEADRLGLPWITQYPAYIYSDYGHYHLPAMRRGMLKGLGIETMIRERTWGTLVLFRPSDYLTPALDQGYRIAFETRNYVVLEWPSRCH